MTHLNVRSVPVRPVTANACDSCETTDVMYRISRPADTPLVHAGAAGTVTPADLEPANVCDDPPCILRVIDAFCDHYGAAVVEQWTADHD